MNTLSPDPGHSHPGADAQTEADTALAADQSATTAREPVDPIGAAPTELDIAGDRPELCPSATPAPTTDETLDPGPPFIGRASRGAFGQADPWRGQLFSGYTLIRKLATGGMGIVYLARQESLRRPVALKMLLAGKLASDEDILRFRREAEAVAQLDHPGIVPIFEVGEHEGLHFFSMAYIAGGTLADRVKDGPVPPREAVELVRRIAEAVGHAHRKGIVHRDLKPGNVLLDEAGQPKITDFGLAKVATGLNQLTMTGQVMGTPSYMAPEQAAGRLAEIGPATDIYALGAILYCMVAGRPPFLAATPVETLKLVLEHDPVSPRELNGTVSRDLETVCLKCLRKEPARRYPDAAALADDLGRILAGESIRARPIGGMDRLWTWCRRNTAIAALALALLASLLGGVIIASLLAARAVWNEAEALKAKSLSDRRWYAAELGLARQEWERGRVATVLRRLESLRPGQRVAPDLRGFEWHDLHRLCHAELRTLGETGEALLGLGFTPTGRYLLSAGGVQAAGEAGTLRLWDSTSGELIRAWTGHAGWVNGLAVRPDGKTVASCSAAGGPVGEVKLWDLPTGDLVACLSGQEAPIRTLAYSPDGRRLAGAGGFEGAGRAIPGELILWDIEGGKTCRRLPGHPDVILAVAFSPDGRRLATGDLRAEIRLWDVERGGLIAVLSRYEKPFASSVTSLSFSPDGRWLAAGSLDRSIRVWDLTGAGRSEAGAGDPLFTLTHPGTVNDLAFSPDGRQLAAGCGDQTVRVWDLASRTIELALRGHTDGVTRVAFSPDGWRIASASEDGRVKVWAVRGDRGVLPLRDHRKRFTTTTSLAFSPDGRWLATASLDQAIRVWDVATGLVLRTLRAHADGIAEIAFSPDGRRLASAGVDETVFIWDLTTGERPRKLDGLLPTVHSIAFSTDGRWLACASAGKDGSGRVQLCNLQGDRPVTTLDGRSSQGREPDYVRVAFSPVGRRLAAGCVDGTMRIWDLDVGGPARILRGHSRPIWDVAFSPDGRRIASAGGDRVILLRDASSGALIGTLSGHTAAVRSVAFSPDGRRLASTGMDLALKFWDPTILEQDPRGQEIDSLRVPWAPARLAFHPDGHRLAIGGSLISESDPGLDHGAAIWDGREPDREIRQQHEARLRLDFWFDRGLSAGQVREQLLRDDSIAETVRRQALELVDAFGRDHARREAEDAIDRLACAGLFATEIRERLATDPELSDTARAEALLLARDPVEKAVHLDTAGRSVTMRPGATRAAYERALAQAQAACRLGPHRTAYRVSLGMAQYRLSAFQQAVETLAAANVSASPRDRAWEPARLAFLAMTLERLSRHDEALATLARFRQALQATTKGGNEWKALEIEAARLIESPRSSSTSSSTPLP